MLKLNSHFELQRVAIDSAHKIVITNFARFLIYLSTYWMYQAVSYSCFLHIIKNFNRIHLMLSSFINSSQLKFTCIIYFVLFLLLQTMNEAHWKSVKSCLNASSEYRNRSNCQFLGCSSSNFPSSFQFRHEFVARCSACEISSSIKKSQF